jgi:hypothetical protein
MLQFPYSEEDGDWEKIGFVNGKGNSAAEQVYRFTDNDLIAGSYSYRLKQIDFDGTFNYSNVINVLVSNPAEFILYQNYPNPFNPSTTIKYSVPEVSNIKIDLYDLLGNKIRTIEEGIKTAGVHFLKFSGEDLSSGVYFVRLSSLINNQYIKIILSK